MLTNILITGVSGFIGSRIALRVKENFSVIPVARKPDGQLDEDLKSNVLKLDLESTTVPVISENVDTIIHVATANDIISKDFKKGLDLSVMGTKKILDIALELGVKNLIFFSTLQVYGTELHGKIDEDNEVNCESPYSLNHFFGEELCKLYAKNYNLNISIIRPSNVYGLPDTDSFNRYSLVPLCFVKEVVDTGQLMIRSSGNQKRNFISTNEIADICINLLESFPEGVKYINAASDLTITIKDVALLTAEVFKDIHGKDLKLEFLSEEPASSNEFSIDSQLHHLRCSPQEAKSNLKNTIKLLFKYMDNKLIK